MSSSSLKRCGSMRTIRACPSPRRRCGARAGRPRHASARAPARRPARPQGRVRRSGRAQAQAMQAVEAAADETLHVRLDGRHAGLLDELQAGGEAGHGEQRRQPQLMATGVGIEEHATRHRRGRAGRRCSRPGAQPCAPAAPPRRRDSRCPAGQQPLHGRARGQVDPFAARSRATTPADWAMSAMRTAPLRMGHVGQRPQVMAHPGLRGHMRDADGDRPVVHERRHVRGRQRQASPTAACAADLDALHAAAAARGTGRTGRSWRRRRRSRRAAGPGAPRPGCRHVTCRP